MTANTLGGVSPEQMAEDMLKVARGQVTEALMSRLSKEYGREMDREACAYWIVHHGLDKLEGLSNGPMK